MTDNDSRPLARLACIRRRSLSFDGGPKVPYGKDTSGRMRLVSEVPRGLACNCTCPACDTPLIAVKNTTRSIPYFSHKGKKDCVHGAETALHQLAKEMLAEMLEIGLPDMVATHAGLSRRIHRGRVVKLDCARLEKHLGDIVPDVIVSRGEQELLVEFHVTHKCGPEKIRRIRELGLSAIEIDLSDLPYDASRDEIASALRHAPRAWLYHREIDKTKAELAQAWSKRQQAQRARDEAFKNRILAAWNRAKSGDRLPPPDLALEADMAIDRVTRLGGASFIGKHVPGATCFLVEPKGWQAMILLRLAEEPPFRQSSIDAKTVLDLLKKAGAIAPGLTGFIPPDIADTVADEDSTFATPWAVVSNFLNSLSIRHAASVINDAIRQERLDGEQRRARHAQVRREVKKILQSLSIEEGPTFRLDRWYSVPRDRFDGNSIAEAVDAGRSHYWTVVTALREISKALFDGGKPVAEALWLPIEAALERAAADYRHKEAEKERQQAEERVSRLAQHAQQTLGSDALLWINEATPFGSAPIDLARQGEDQLSTAIVQLRREANRREAVRQREHAATLSRERLREEANRRLPPDLAELFLASGQPALQGRRPIDACVDQESLALCLDLIPRKRHRRA